MVFNLYFEQRNNEAGKIVNAETAGEVFLRAYSSVLIRVKI